MTEAVEGAEESSLMIENSLSRLSEHLLNDKKLGRASTIFVELIRNSLNQANSSLFFNTIQSLLSECPSRDVLDTKFVNYYIDIFNAIEQKLHLFENHNQRFRLTTFSIFIRMRNDLKTSDSFQFAKTCTAVKLLFESLELRPNTSSGIDEENDSTKEKESNTLTVDEDCLEERQRVLLAVLSVATDSYRWAWAQNSVESLINIAAERRLSFHIGPIREELDSITERITLQKRKNVSYTGSKKVVSTSAIAHPLFIKKYDTCI